METDKEIELQILSTIAEAGNMIEKDLNKMFAGGAFAYIMVFKRIINFRPALISEFDRQGIAGERKYYRISEYGELRRKILQKEKNDEKAAWILRTDVVKHSGIVRNGTKFLLIISLLTLLAAIYLIYLESGKSRSKGANFKAVTTK